MTTSKPGAADTHRAAAAALDRLAALVATREARHAEIERDVDNAARDALAHGATQAQVAPLLGIAPRQLRNRLKGAAPVTTSRAAASSLPSVSPPPRG